MALTLRSLATCQTVPLPGDLEGNRTRHLHAAEAAVEEGAQVCVFPELSLLGYELGRARELALAPEDERLEPLVEEARRGRITLVVGAPLALGDSLHIAAFVLDPDGGVRHYTKRRLGAFPSHASTSGVVPPPEPDQFQPRHAAPEHVFPHHRAALAICADTGDPAHPERAARRGATSYLASMFFTSGERAAEESRLAGHARNHGMAVCLSNYGGPTGGLEAAGGSAIWSPTGDLLVQLPTRGASLAVAHESAGRGNGPPRWHATTRSLAD